MAQVQQYSQAPYAAIYPATMDPSSYHQQLPNPILVPRTTIPAGPISAAAPTATPTATAAPTATVIPVVTPAGGKAVPRREIKLEKMVEAWDKIGGLMNEMTKSAMKKEATMVATRFRQRCEDGQQQQQQEDVGPALKKQRLTELGVSSPSSSDELTITPPESSSPPLVAGPPNFQKDETWSQGLTRRVDRMARMSKLMMEMEYSHCLMRKEMLDMQNDMCPHR